MPDDAPNASAGSHAPPAPLVPTGAVPGSSPSDQPWAVPAPNHDEPNHGHGGVAALAIGAVGVVFGDIGTSPLYAIQETVIKHGGAEREFIMGVLSLVFWALFLVVVAKYQLLIMRATNRGEGGLFSLLSLLPRGLQRRADYRLAFFGAIAIIGSALEVKKGIIRWATAT